MFGCAGGGAVVEIVVGREGGRDDQRGVEAESDGWRRGSEDEDANVVCA